ncbi:MAG TPA: 23S rRNA (guanosine(2251)-2'-O)-methyltransferase RlmB [Solirubrobacteraceae bacterium]|nr:23S rRNA (guanosine(2251)-2'-O)-methyltransferase RlmB [Solirubrobacteraceae bacterium]
MIIYGRNPVREALRGPRTVRRIWATKNTLREPWLAEPGGRGPAPVPAPAVVSAEEVQEICGSPDHQGVCAEVSSFRYADADALLGGGGGPLVALDQIQDPQNLGAICRSAECAGAAGVVLPERRAAEVTPAVCKASAGAVEHLPVARVRNLADFLAQAKSAGRWCYGAQADAKRSYQAVDYTGPLVLVLGSEGRGLRPRVAAACDELVSIPLRGRIESLSVSAAAAVLLYAATAARG